jgi:hypothetical protein
MLGRNIAFRNHSHTGTKMEMVCVVGIGGLGSAAVERLRADAAPSVNARFIHLLDERLAGAQIVCAFGRVPKDIVESMADLSWIDSLNIGEPVRVIVLAHLSNPELREVLLPTLLRLKARSLWTSLVLVYPWEMTDEGFAPSQDTRILETLELARLVASDVRLTQGDYAREQLAFWRSCAPDTSLSEEISGMFSAWHQQDVEAMAGAARAALRN